MNTNIKEVNEHINNLNNEVARLRKVCVWAAHMMDGISPARGQEIRDAIARIASAPEEPVTGLCLICHEIQTTCSSGLCEKCKEPVPEWRELGPDEVIQEGDEYKCLGTWRRDSELKGMKVKHTGGKFRTRRPLPVIQDSRITEPEWRELGPDEVICEGDEIQWPYKDWQTAKSSIGYKVGYWDGLVKARTRRPLPKAQEEMPLEKELDYLTREASRAADIHNHVLIVDCIHYLRNEIQKLKGDK